MHDRTPTSVLLERRGARLDPVLRRYLEGCVRAPFSFHEITRCDPGHGFRTRDVFTHEEKEVLERSASRGLQVGDTLFDQLVDTDGITLLEACAPHTIPPGATIELIDLRARMARNTGEVMRADLVDWDTEVREAYHDLMDRLLNPRLPRLQNTDGEDLVWHRSIFDVESTAEAFAALVHLSAHEPDAEVADSASYGDDGILQRVSFAWTVSGNRAHGDWSNTVLGHIEIDGGRLSAQVNSAERAARLKHLIENALGERARYRATEIQSIESALETRRQSGAGSTAALGLS